MAIGYEGYIRIGGDVVLGTGSAVPRIRPRLDSSSGYGGKISDATQAGIGLPHNYDWEQHDGSVNFEVTSGLFGTLKSWILDRQGSESISLLSRDGNSQAYDNAYWNSISMSASSGSAIEGSVGFTAIVRDSYAYGVLGTAGYIGNKVGQGVVNGTFPLNPSPTNLNPVPFWKTQVTLGGNPLDFLTWSLDLSQEVVKFFGCGGNYPTPQEPIYLAVGPMTATFTGTYMFQAPAADSLNGLLNIGGTTLNMNRMELQTISDDVQTGDSPVPLSVEYAIYELN